MSRPIISGDLVDAAAALLLCQHDSPLIDVLKKANQITRLAETTGYEGEENLMAARVAASAYLVTCFEYAASAVEDD